MKKLLLLGGLKYLIPVIKKAKKLGYYVITCDYLPDNIAHQYSDEYHNISIIDKEKVLALAKKLEINGIMSFAVDPGVLTAAFVSEKLGLNSAGPYKSIEILQNKSKFRNFLKDNGFNVPKSKSYSDINKAINEFNFKLPVIVKPVDSAGSKGVSKVSNIDDLKNAITFAKENSPTQTFIIEDFLESSGYPSDSDCFSLNGSLDFITFSNQRFDKDAPNPYTPSGFTWPSTMSITNKNYLKAELRRLIKLLDMRTSIYNIEVRISTDGTPYIMEVSPRGGGNRIAEMIEKATGTDLITYAIQYAMNEDIKLIPSLEYKTNLGQIILHSNKSGRFKKLEIDPEIKNNVLEIDLWVKENEYIHAFSSANHSLGTLVLAFKDNQMLEKVVSNYSKYINIITD